MQDLNFNTNLHAIDPSLDYRMLGVMRTHFALAEAVEMMVVALSQAQPLIAGQLDSALRAYRHTAEEMNQCLIRAAVEGAGELAHRTSISREGWRPSLGIDIPVKIDTLEAQVHDSFKDTRFDLDVYFRPQIEGFFEAPQLPTWESLPRIPTSDQGEVLGPLGTGLYCYNPTGGWRSDQVAVLLDMKGINWVKLLYVPATGHLEQWVWVSIEQQWLKYQCLRYMQRSVYEGELKKILLALGQPLVLGNDLGSFDPLERIPRSWVNDMLGEAPAGESPTHEQHTKGQNELYWFQREAFYTPEGETPKRMTLLEWVTRGGVFTLSYDSQRFNLNVVRPTPYSTRGTALEPHEWSKLHPYTQYRLIEGLKYRVQVKAEELSATIEEKDA